MSTYLDFEQPILELEGKIEELKRLQDAEMDIAEEVARLSEKVERMLKATYGKLTPWQKVQVARHPSRPRCGAFIDALIEDFTQLAGDKLYGEDAAIIGGIGRFHGRSVMVIGQERGNDLASRLKHNFGMPKPEGYRKAQRLMKMADHFGLPILTFVDTPGAYPGIGAEERGQAEAIARSIDVGLSVTVPLITTIIGEGGSGGAIALATGNRVIMLEHAVYSVISPEGCASILWRSASEAETAAEALKITAQDLLRLGVIDEIVPEPLGGAHRHPTQAISLLKSMLARHLDELAGEEAAVLKLQRQEKFLAMGRAA
jgi:acetyl-CoA carboxylase carboxyl transferase subunit alpha